MLYVAVTRTKNSIHIPESLVPEDFPVSDKIHLVKSISAEDQKTIKKLRRETAETKSEKAYSLDEIRLVHKGAYNPWTTALDDELTIMFCEGMHEKDMAIHFGRTRGAIKSRIKKLDLEKLYG